MMDGVQGAGMAGAGSVGGTGTPACPMTTTPSGRSGWPPPGYRHLFPAMPPPLPPAPPDMALRQSLAALARAMQASAPLDQRGDNPGIPAGYTYLMQFVAHDIVRTAVAFWQLGISGRETRDLRGGRLRLETLYGGGPAACPYAYMTEVRSRLRIMPLARHDADDSSGSPLRDIPRARLDPPPPGWQAGRRLPLDEALLPDPRNDDNSNVSQTTVLFAAFHNAVVDCLSRADAMPGMRFAVAREAVTLVYRRILREDLLRRLLHPQVYAHYTAYGAEFLDDGGAATDRMALEFCFGAFRCGHAMVRESYRINGDDERELAGILRATSGGGAGAMPLSRIWTIRWSHFFDIQGPGLPRPNASRRLRPQHSPGLLDTRFFDAIDDTFRAGLAYRDLLGAGVAGLHPVAELWNYLRAERPALAALSEMSDPAVRRAALDQWLAGAGVGAAHAAPLAAAPPLPFYVLLEAEQECSGLTLGVLGSVIVAETMLGLMARDPLPCEAGGGDVPAALAQLAAAAGVAPAVLAPLAGITDMPGMVRFAAGAPGIGPGNPAFV